MYEQIPLIVLVLSVIMTVVIAVRNMVNEKYIRSGNVVHILREHGGIIHLNENVTLTLIHDKDVGEPIPHTEQFIVRLAMKGQTIDESRIDIVSHIFYSNHRDVLQFEGPWNSFILKQFQAYSRTYDKRRRTYNKRMRIARKKQHGQTHNKLKEYF